MLPCKTQTTDREKIAAAAAERAKVEEEKKKARKEAAARQKEAAERAEEEQIKSMKRKAREIAEALERKEAIKAIEAQSCAAAAAEERAAKAGATDHYLHTTQDILKKEVQERENNSVFSKTQFSEEYSRENTNFELHNKHKRYKEEERRKEEEELRAMKQAAAEASEALERKEAVNKHKRYKEEEKRKEEEELRAMKQAAAEAAEALERKEAVKAAEAKAAAAAAAEKRAAKAAAANGKSTFHTSSQIKTQEKEIIDVTRENHTSTAGTESMSCYRNNDYTERDKPLKLMASHKSESSEINKLQTSAEVSKQQIGKSVMLSHANEKESLTSADDLKNLQNKLGFYEETHLTNQNGARPKGRNSESSIHTANVQVGQSGGQPNKSSSNIAVQQNVNTMHRLEKEIVSGNSASQLGNSGGQKEIVSVTGHEKYSVKEFKETLRYGEKSDIHDTELHSKRNMKISVVEENKETDIQSYQNGHVPGSRGHKDSIYHGEHSRRTQQHYTPPAQRNEGLQHHREQQNHNHYRYKSRGMHPNYLPYNHQPRAQMSHSHRISRSLVCGSCDENFNLQERLPRNLNCGHSICTVCITYHICNDNNVSCPFCPVRTWHVKDAEQCSVNQPLVKILSEESMQNCVMKENQEEEWPCLPEGRDKRQYQSQPGNYNMAGSGMGHVGNKSLPPMSPHGSKCLEVGVRPSSYCCTCEVWVCARCAAAEHSSRRCSLKSVKDQLLAMKQEHEHKSKMAQELLGKSLQSLENNLDEGRISLIWMRAAFECMEKEQKYMKKEVEEGRKLMNTLTDAMKSGPCATNLPEALAVFQMVENRTNAACHWASSTELGATGCDQETTVCIRHLMKRTLRSLQVVNGTSEMCAVDKLIGGELYSELTRDGGRFHLHALRKKLIPSQGVRALPLECFKSCQATASALVFLDLSWDGVDQGRLYIRLTGDTLCGRQFLSLCLGDGGTSFRGTCFHRVWWKGLPGEHIWTGDYENRDGSGGKSLLPPNNHGTVAAGREVPISAGLVAGRYEKENISSIFRIYTREEKDGTDEAGFGQVEFGLDVVRKAIRLRNIRDVVIGDCGLVLEME